MSLEILAQTFISGLYLGGIYAMVAMGLTLVYGVMYIVNFAQADFLMLGMYMSYWIYALLGIDPYISAIFVAITFFFIGALLQWSLVQRILNAQLMNQILLTIGLSTVMIGFAQFMWKTDPRSVIVPYSAKGLRVAGLVFNMPRSIALLAAVLFAVLLYLFLKRTKIGKAIRACSQSRDAARLMGINVGRIYMITFGIGAALSSVAGALLIPSLPVTPNIGATLSITSFVVVVLGTMGNFVGAFFGGLLLGVAESYGGLLISGAVKQVVSMSIFILILLFRPNGLFGGRT